MFFLEGPNASTGLTEIDIVEIGQKNGVRISVVPVKAFFMTALGLCPGPRHSDDIISIAISWK